MVELSCEAIWSWAFLCWEVFDYYFISSLVTDLFRPSISSWFNLGKLYVSRSLSNFSTLSNLFTIVLYDPLYFWGIHCNVSSFISDFIYLSLLSFLLSVAKGLTIVFNSFKIFFYFFLILYWINFYSDLFYFLPSSNFWFSLFFFFYFLET